MKRNIKHITLSICCAFLFYACRKCETTTYSFTQEELEWLFYTQGQQIIFESNLGNFDTIKVINVWRDFIYDGYDKCVTTKEDRAGINIEVNNTSYPNPMLQIWKEYSSFNGYVRGLNFCNRTYINQLPSIIDTITINGILYKNVYEIINDTSKCSDPGDLNLNTKCSFNKEFGILKYENVSGEIFYLKP